MNNICNDTTSFNSRGRPKSIDASGKDEFIKTVTEMQLNNTSMKSYETIDLLRNITKKRQLKIIVHVV